jgi:hypothetical protein
MKNPVLWVQLVWGIPFFGSQNGQSWRIPYRLFNLCVQHFALSYTKRAPVYIGVASPGPLSSDELTNKCYRLLGTIPAPIREPWKRELWPVGLLQQRHTESGKG